MTFIKNQCAKSRSLPNADKVGFSRNLLVVSTGQQRSVQIFYKTAEKKWIFVIKDKVNNKP